MILIAMSAEVIRFERLSLREEYDSCPDFGEIYVTLRDDSLREMDGFLLQDGYLFRFRKLCISRTSLKNFLSKEIHTRGLAGHFSQNKTIEAVEHRFYWSNLKKDDAKIIEQCGMCQLAKQQKQIARPYTPLPMSNCS